MGTVTLVPPARAEVGAAFVFRGAADGCEGCPYREQCLNLESGVRYRVTDVREGGQALDCAVHAEGEVVAVEVERAPVPANVPAKAAYAGSATRLAGPCPHTECPSHARCEPAGAEFDREYRIAAVEGDPPHEECALDRDLVAVTFAPPEG